jgi:hypothetical protein
MVELKLASVGVKDDVLILEHFSCLVDCAAKVPEHDSWLFIALLFCERTLGH